MAGLTMGMKLFTIRALYGYEGFAKKISDTMLESNAVAFEEALNHAKEPIDPKKVSTLSQEQITWLRQDASNAYWMIPMLNRMGELGMMDLRTELNHDKMLAEQGMLHLAGKTSSEAYKLDALKSYESNVLDALEETLDAYEDERLKELKDREKERYHSTV